MPATSDVLDQNPFFFSTHSYLMHVLGIYIISSERK